jgi:hypothetical protein|tara:strand:- start:171 stop:710 length:540 start_codon:yes stop_codon:yes gene_type:complete
MKKRRAVFVLGAESSGTRNMTRLLVESGYAGTHEHNQRYDNFELLIQDKPDRVVIRRSVPHGLAWVNTQEVINFLKELGYFVSCIVTIRDWNCMVESQINAGHVKDKRKSKTNIRQAYAHIFSQLYAAGIEYVPVSYESLVQHPTETLERLGEELQINFPEVHGVYDGNNKYYSQTEEE